MKQNIEGEYHKPEVADLEKSRTISDAELLKKGAKYVVDKKGEKSLRVTGEQIKSRHDNFEKKTKKDDEKFKEIREEIKDNSIYLNPWITREELNYLSKIEGLKADFTSVSPELRNSIVNWRGSIYINSKMHNDFRSLMQDKDRRTGDALPHFENLERIGGDLLVGNVSLYGHDTAVRFTAPKLRVIGGEIIASHDVDDIRLYLPELQSAHGENEGEPGRHNNVHYAPYHTSTEELF